uniref:Uncharacterized protein n=1 Tax=Tetraselmis sp. GSL018 TaxID=582737 RepID=A0A061SIA2_9CHLO
MTLKAFIISGAGLMIRFAATLKLQLAVLIQGTIGIEPCEQFCESSGYVGNVPIVVGGSWGANLEQAASVCLSEDLLRSEYSKEQQEFCFSDNSIELMEKATSQFISDLRVFKYDILAYKGDILQKSHRIAQELNNPDNVMSIDESPNPSRLNSLREAYSDFPRDDAEGEMGEIRLRASIESLRKSAKNLNSVLSVQASRFENFLTTCDRFFPRENRFLLDMCTVSGSKCIEDSQSEHVSCCCLQNPMLNLEHRKEAVMDAKSLQHSRQLELESTAVDVCSEAAQQSDEKVREVKTYLDKIGRSDVHRDYESRLRDKYNNFYSSDCQGQMTSKVLLLLCLLIIAF